jgi:hypothetical protein
MESQLVKQETNYPTQHYFKWIFCGMAKSETIWKRVILKRKYQDKNENAYNQIPTLYK